MNVIARSLERICLGIPTTLPVFLGAGLLDNAVNLFVNVFGTDDPPKRSDALLLSALISLVAAALWTVLATKLEQIERASSHPTTRTRAEERAHVYQFVRRRVAGYLMAAIVSSVGAIVALVVR